MGLRPRARGGLPISYARAIRPDVPEISDLIVAYDPDTLQRIPVRRDDVVARFEELGRARAARIVARMPTCDGVLDPAAVDATLIRAHRELQRLSEEFRQGLRVRELLVPTIAVLRARGISPIRVVDVGCGLGYLVRWLAAYGDLGDDVQLVGCDYNAALIHEAARLAELESLPCELVVGNAFTLEQPGHIFTSTGVLHHFRDEGLRTFFREQARGAQAFFHYDIDASWLAPIGSWLFHRARMREPLARHDGVLSAMRAHSRQALIDAATFEGFRVALYRVPHRLLPIVRVLRPVVGLREELWDDWRAALGPNARLLVNA